MGQDYNKMLWEYKQMRDEIQWNECTVYSDDDEEVKEKKSMLAMELVGNIQMY